MTNCKYIDKRGICRIKGSILDWLKQPYGSDTNVGTKKE